MEFKLELEAELSVVQNDYGLPGRAIDFRRIASKTYKYDAVSFQEEEALIRTPIAYAAYASYPPQLGKSVMLIRSVADAAPAQTPPLPEDQPRHGPT